MALTQAELDEIREDTEEVSIVVQTEPGAGLSQEVLDEIRAGTDIISTFSTGLARFTREFAQQPTAEEASLADLARADAEIPIGQRVEAGARGVLAGATRAAHAIPGLAAQGLSLLGTLGGQSQFGPPRSEDPIVQGLMGVGEAAIGTGELRADAIRGGRAEMVRPIEARFLERGAEELTFGAGSIAAGIGRRALRADPRRFLRQETAANLGAAGAGQAAVEADLGTGAEIGAQLGGGIAPTAAGAVFQAVRAAGRGLGAVFRVPGHRRRLDALERELDSDDADVLGRALARPGRGGRTLREGAAERIREGVGGPEEAAFGLRLIDEMEGLARTERINPNFIYSASAASQTPGGRALLFDAIQNNPRLAHQMETALSNMERSTKQRLMDLSEGLGDTANTMAAVEMQALREMRFFDDQARQLAPSGSAEDISQVAHGLRKERYARATEENGQRFANIATLSRELPWDNQAAKIALADIQGPVRFTPNGARLGLTPAEQKSIPEINGAIQLIGDFRGSSTFDELRTTRQFINGLIGEVSPFAQKLLYRLKAGVDESLDSARTPISQAERLTPEQLARMTEVRTLYWEAVAGHAAFSQTYREGITGVGVALHSAVPESATLSRYLHAKGTGATEDLAEFVTKFGDDPDLRRTATDYLVAEAYQTMLVNGGSNKLGKLNAWRTARPHILSEFPEVNRITQEIGDLTRRAREIGAVHPERGLQSGNLALRNFLKEPSTLWRTLKKGDVDANLDRFLGRIEGDDAAMGGLRRLYMDDVVNTRNLGLSGGPSALEPARGLSAITNNPKERAIILRLFGQEHLDHLDNTGRLMDELGGIPTGGRAQAPTAREPSVILRGFAKATGFMTIILSGRQRALRTGAAAQEVVRLLSEPQIDIILAESFRNPTLMRLLWRDASESTTRDIRRWLNTNIPSLGVRAGAGEVGPEAEIRRRPTPPPAAQLGLQALGGAAFGGARQNQFFQ